MNWEIEYYKETVNKPSPVEEFINKLGTKDKKAQAKVLRSLLLLSEYGLSLGFPYISNISKKLWELRIPFGNNQYRVLFTIASNRIIILLHAFSKKTGKIPDKELKIAHKRLSKVTKERRPQ
jgi:phage-related protein